MKKVVIRIKKEELENILPVISNKQYYISEGDELFIINMILPNYELNDVMDNLNKKIDFRYKKNIVEVFTPDFIVSPFLQKVEKENSCNEKEPIEKLIDTTRPYLKIDKNKLALTSIAGIIALTGLFMNNVAVIIGAMLLSPILGPIYAFAINSALGRTKDILKSVSNLLLMISTVLFFSIVITFLISFFMEPTLTQEILSRLDPNFIYVLMSLALGFASMLAITKGIPESTAGVAIAAALLPPTAVSGILIIINPAKAIGPMILVFQNIFGLMTGSLFGAILLEIGPREYYKKTASKKIIFRLCLIMSLLVLALIVLTV